DSANRVLPGVIVSAGGVETAPIISDSSGFFIITLRVSPGTIVQLRAEKNGYNPAARTIGAQAGVPTSMTLSPRNTASALDVAGAVSSSLDKVDVFYRQMDAFQPGAPQTAPIPPRPFNLKATQKGSNIDFAFQS